MLNEYQQKLFTELSELTNNSDGTFYTRDFNRDGIFYRIFAYRLASYTEFLKPSAIECRGTMFEITDPSIEPVQAIRLVSLPMEKFWNLNENPATMNLDLSQVVEIQVKADGSLISTYLHKVGSRDVLGIKSKTSLDSDQVNSVYKYLMQAEKQEVATELFQLALSKYTVNMEWCAPDNRIVLGYIEPKLITLNIRDNVSGAYVDRDDVQLIPFPAVRENWIESVQFSSIGDFINDIPDMPDVEGFVLRLSSGQRVKIKTNWYLALHHTRDSINSDRRLYETVLAEASDDLRALFFNDPLVLDRIEKMEAFVEEKFKKLSSEVDNFYEANKQLSRKEYAILAKQQLDRHAFRIAMERYIGREISIKQYMSSKWKEFGVKDQPVIATDEL